jgi:NADPH-dependent 2,4-dienoyl-CoA reductase/sulfur reductase-like enzyme
VIVGGGPAGVSAALAARQQDASAEIVLLSEELHEPYEKPPLSKAVLTGKAAPHNAPIAGPKGVVGSGVVLKPGWRVNHIDCAARTVVGAAGEHIGYDALVLATGAIKRRAPWAFARGEWRFLFAHEGRSACARGRSSPMAALRSKPPPATLLKPI